MKKLLLLVLLLSLYSCWSEENDKIETWTGINIAWNIVITDQKDVKNEENEKRDSSKDGSSLEYEREEIKIKKIDNWIEVSNWVIISEWIPDSFTSDFSSFWNSKVYKNSRVWDYLITSHESSEILKAVDYYIFDLEKKWWTWSEFELPEINDEFDSKFLLFNKKTESWNEELKISFSKKVPEILADKLWLKWFFIEINYIRPLSVSTELNND